MLWLFRRFSISRGSRCSSCSERLTSLPSDTTTSGRPASRGLNPSMSAVTGCLACLGITVKVPSGSITPYFTSATDATFCFRKVSMTSSVVKRIWRSFWISSLPPRIIIAGCPLSRRRNGRLLSARKLKRISSTISVAIGTRPDTIGIPRSCMGTAARSETRMVTTSSDGSRSPICRLPIRRMAAITAIYSSSVRSIGTAIVFYTSFWFTFRLKNAYSMAVMRQIIPATGI